MRSATLLLVGVISVWVRPCGGRRIHLGPTVDPGVFVLTHIGSCRGGRGYCVLGFNCGVDKDFVDDDLGGHCDGLKDAFSPEAKFVCCRENPDNFLGSDYVVVGGEPTTHAQQPEATTSVVTETFTELVTVVEQVTEIKPVTAVSPITTQSPANSDRVDADEVTTTTELMRPGIVIDDSSLLQNRHNVPLEPDSTENEETSTDTASTESSSSPRPPASGSTDTSCFAAAVLGLECPADDGPEKAVRKSPDSSVHENGLDIENTQAKVVKEKDDPMSTPLLDLSDSLEEDLSLGGHAGTHQSQASPQVEDDPQCGLLGGRGVFNAFGHAAERLLPDLVANWVTGRISQRKAFESIGGGTVTSTVIYCWMAAVMRKKDRKKGEHHDKFVCTGSLVQRDLIVTSASCAHLLMVEGKDKFRVIVGDSNLNVDLPFGVQIFEVVEVSVHKGFDPEASPSPHDVALIRLDSKANMTSTVCTLCLPSSEDRVMVGSNCTVVSYGRRPPTNDDSFKEPRRDRDSVGILRKAAFGVISSTACSERLGRDPTSHFLCADGMRGTMKSCQVSLDGGSPMICRLEDRHTLMGMVASQGTAPCFGGAGEPALFTDVLQHVQWIRSALN